MTPTAASNASSPPLPQQLASDLFQQGNAVEASRLLTDAIVKCESPGLWNDWSVVQLSLAERAFRRALQLHPSHPDSSANLGFLLFIMGKTEEAAVLLNQALVTATGPARLHIQSLLAACTPAPANAPIPSTMDHETLFRRFHHVLVEFFEKGNRSAEVVTPPGFQPIVDAMPNWIEATLGNGSVHDEDYLVFGAFKDPESTILDIGAHYGYSAASIWSAGSASSVISFEANPAFEPCFQRIALLRPGLYDYCLSALGDSPGLLTFAMPTINGHGIGALNTACAAPSIEGLATNLTDFFEKYLAGQSLDSFLIHTFQCPVARLDDLLATHRFAFPTNNVVAVKVDTEGLEGEVLAGSRSLLVAQRPLILAEAGHSNVLVSKELLPLGYAYARRIDRQLQIAPGPIGSVNGFYIHPSHFDEYRRIELLMP